MTEGESDTSRRTPVTRLAARALLVLLAVYLLVVEMAQWSYLAYKGTQSPETHGDPVANAVVGLVPPLVAGVVAWTSHRRGRDRWAVTRVTALTVIPLAFVASALSSGGWV